MVFGCRRPATIIIIWETTRTIKSPKIIWVIVHMWIMAAVKESKAPTKTHTFRTRDCYPVMKSSRPWPWPRGHFMKSLALVLDLKSLTIGCRIITLLFVIIQWNRIRELKQKMFAFTLLLSNTLWTTALALGALALTPSLLLPSKTYSENMRGLWR